jgi:hypothetical protein
MLPAAIAFGCATGRAEEMAHHVEQGAGNAVDGRGATARPNCALLPLGRDAKIGTGRGILDACGR